MKTNKQSKTTQTLQSPVPFSESMIWQLQRDYFNEAGVDAWRTGEVPHYITSNAYLARKYASLFRAFVKDRKALGFEEERYFVMELGAGSGRLAYHFLKEMEHLDFLHGEVSPDFCYVLSDLAESNMQFWQTHPRLQPYISKGKLDMTLLDAVNPGEIKLRLSGKILQEENADCPLIILANYFFDGIPVSLFRVDGPEINEMHLGLKTLAKDKNTSAAEVLKSIEAYYEVSDKKSAWYEEDFLNKLVEEYASLNLKTHILFQDTGIRLLEYFRKTFSQFMLLTTDKGYHRPEDLNHFEPPRLVKHGSFSLTVNYHSLGMYCHLRKGMVQANENYPSHINVQQMLFVNEAQKYAHSQLAYRREVIEFGPDEFYSVRQQIVKNIEQSGIGQLLAGLRFTCFDPQLYKLMLPRMSVLASSLRTNDRVELLKTSVMVWDNFYPLGEGIDLAFEIGIILYKINYAREALRFFELSVVTYGDQQGNEYNRALCHLLLGEREKAQILLNKLLKQNPGNEQVLAVLDQIKKENKRQFVDKPVE